MIVFTHEIWKMSGESGQEVFHSMDTMCFRHVVTNEKCSGEKKLHPLLGFIYQDFFKIFC